MQIYIVKSGQKTGPFSTEQLESMLNSEMIELKDSAWHDGLTEWQPIHQVLNIAPPTPQPPAIPDTSPDQASTKIADGVSKLLFEGEQIIDWSYPSVSYTGNDVSISDLKDTGSFVITNLRIILNGEGNAPGEYTFTGSDITCINLEGVSSKAEISKYQPNSTLGVMLMIGGGGLTAAVPPIGLALMGLGSYLLFFNSRKAIWIPGAYFDVDHLPDTRIKELLTHIKSIQ